jgi:3-phenylpropionate/trans-cinnamate dioxygenase ferredoxin reductase component
MSRRVVIVGAGLAGSRCAQTLRAEGYDGPITLVGDEPHPPYERPALSKEFLAGTRDDLLLQASTAWVDLEIDLEPGVRVERIDTRRRLARTSCGDLVWDALVLATGARARRPAAFRGSGVHVLRTLDDARRLRSELVPGRRLAIVGAGFVGTEVASTAAVLGVEVTIIDLASLPFEQTLGPEVGRILADRYREHGVDLRLGAGVERVLRGSDGTLRGLRLSDGTKLERDLVLVAVGAEPAGELLRDAPGPIETDAGGRTGLPNIYACGDVAAPWSAAHSRHVRFEHWTSAAGQAAVVARAILGGEPGTGPTPYFWSDQFGLRLQHVGSAEGWERIVLDGDESSLAARYLGRDGRLVGALLVNRPQQVGALRRELAPELLAAA